MRACEFIIYLCVLWSRPTQTIDNSLFSLCFETNICLFSLCFETKIFKFCLCFETNICIFWLCFETNFCKNICVIQRFLVICRQKIKLLNVLSNFTQCIENINFAINLLLVCYYFAVTLLLF